MNGNDQTSTGVQDSAEVEGVHNGSAQVDVVFSAAWMMLETYGSPS